jgi:hypothetical protein
VGRAEQALDLDQGHGGLALVGQGVSPSPALIRPASPVLPQVEHDPTWQVLPVDRPRGGASAHRRPLELGQQGISVHPLQQTRGPEHGISIGHAAQDGLPVAPLEDQGVVGAEQRQVQHDTGLGEDRIHIDGLG